MPVVVCYIDSLKNEDFRNRDMRVYRYDDTWDTELLFSHVRDNPASSLPQDTAGQRTIHLRKLRGHVTALARVLLAYAISARRRLMVLMVADAMFPPCSRSSLFCWQWLSSSLAAKLLRGVTRPSADVYSSGGASC